MMEADSRKHIWNDPKKPNIIITGSSGLIGSALVRRLAGEFQVIGFDNIGEPFPPPQAECVGVDLTQPESIKRGMERVEYAYGKELAAVIHLAAYYDFSGEPSPLYEEVTVKGTERLLKALSGFQVERFIFSSTMLVHRPTQPGSPITEERTLEGKWDYPASKIKTEKIIHDHREDIPVVTLRIAGVYTDDCDSTPLSRQIQRICEDRLTGRVFPGDVSHGQAFIHLDDVVEAFCLTVEKRREIPEEAALLIGEPQTYSYDRIQREIARLTHGEEEWETEEIPKPVAKTGAWIRDKIPGIEEPFIKPWMIDVADDHYELDISQAKETLNWEPKHRLIDAIPKMIHALKSDPAEWRWRHGLQGPGD